jgi:hypothetical protein
MATTLEHELNELLNEHGAERLLKALAEVLDEHFTKTAYRIKSHFRELAAEVKGQ